MADDESQDDKIVAMPGASIAAAQPQSNSSPQQLPLPNMQQGVQFNIHQQDLPGALLQPATAQAAIEAVDRQNERVHKHAMKRTELSFGQKRFTQVIAVVLVAILCGVTLILALNGQAELAKDVIKILAGGLGGFGLGFAVAKKKEED